MWLATAVRGAVHIALSAVGVGGDIEGAIALIQKATRLTLPRTLRSHHRELRRRLNRMPFIYRGDQADIEHDYVVARLAPIDLATLSTMDGDSVYPLPDAPIGALEVADLDMRAAFLMVRHHRFALIVGDAGMGKTTFSSHALLNAITRHDITSGFYPFKPTERLVPFFVPLKAVDERDELPILKYLLRSNTYLGVRGLHRLNKLVKGSRLLLVLDGFDELYVPESGTSRIIADLNAMISGEVPSFLEAGSTSSLVKGIYELMPGCRLWLTSRKDFYRENRLDRDGKAREREANKKWLAYYHIDFDDPGVNQRFRRDQPTGFAAVKIVGVQARSEIVAKIFNRYRHRDPNSYAWLDERAFLRFINNEFDEETLRLSDNPLFLTAMCYMYINTGEQSKSHLSDRNTLTELIVGCAKLLLVEVDKQKLHGIAADVPVARRLEFTNEKLGFLQFFAARSFSDEVLFRRNVFRLNDLYDAAELYFQDSSWPREILTDIRRRSRDNLVRMLITQGIFVIVDEFPGEVLYDFPHRRFREVLAVQYLDNPKHVDECIAVAGEVRYREFLIIFFASSARYQDRILSALLERCDSSIHGEYYTNLVGECLTNKPASYTAAPLLDKWIRAVASDGTYDRIPDAIARHVEHSPELVAWLNYRLSAAVRANAPWEVRRYATVLGQVASVALVAWAAAYLEEEDTDDLTVDGLVDVLRSDHLDELRQAMIRANKVGLTRLAARVVSPAAAPHDIFWWRHLIEHLSGDARDEVTALAVEAYPRLGSAITGWLEAYKRYSDEVSQPEPKADAQRRKRKLEFPTFDEFWT